MIPDKLVGFDFKDGIYVIDTRSFRVTKWTEFPERLYILDSDPLTKAELYQFLSIIQEKVADFTTDWTSEVADGFWPLKYLYVIWNGEDKYYILSRYLKKIKWKKFLTV
jgi:hypothetical protein